MCCRNNRYYFNTTTTNSLGLLGHSLFFWISIPKKCLRRVLFSLLYTIFLSKLQIFYFRISHIKMTQSRSYVTVGNAFFIFFSSSSPSPHFSHFSRRRPHPRHMFDTVHANALCVENDPRVLQSLRTLWQLNAYSVDVAPEQETLPNR